MYYGYLAFFFAVFFAVNAFAFALVDAFFAIFGLPSRFILGPIVYLDPVRLPIHPN